MSGLDLFLTGVALSMDAFAVAVCQGLMMPALEWRSMTALAAWFGAFQALMPLLGWFLGETFAAFIGQVDHWLAFALLACIGGNMIREAQAGSSPAGSVAWDGRHGRLRCGQILLLAVATSMDALAVGVSFAFLRVRILPASAIIGTTTFCISLLGAVVGNGFGRRFEQQAQMAGGGILILLGLRILMQHG